MRCFELPCVKESGFACPVDIFCSRSSPTAEPRKSGLRHRLARQAALLRRMRQIPAKQSAANSIFTDSGILRAVDFAPATGAAALYAQNILHVVAQFVREHVGLREFA